MDANKLRKKIQRSVALHRKHEPDAIHSEQPTRFLHVANAGVVCGVQWQQLMEIFGEFGALDSVHVLPNAKPYAYVVYKDVSSAVRALDTLQGQHPAQVDNPTVVFYLSYLDALPNSVRSVSVNSTLPSGLHIVDDFVDSTTEAALIALVDSLPKPAASAQGWLFIDVFTGSLLKSRRVHHFGYEFDYSNNQVNFDQTNTPPIPNCFEMLIDKIMDTHRVGVRPNQCTVNVYQPGQGIASHVDTHSAFEDAIVSLSLHSDVVMEFRSQSNPSDCLPVLLPTRSLTVMTGASRYSYKHGISTRKYDALPGSGELRQRQLRYSLTFRAIRRKPCECDFPEHCDHAGREVFPGDRPALPASDTEAACLERSYVTQVYDVIAHHFDVTRHSQWRAVRQFLDKLSAGDVLLDVGCGNGKYLAPDDRQLVKLGCDMCASLCSIAHSKGSQVAQADCLHLPFASGRFDAAICIAVVHHMATEKRRQQAIGELLRVVRPGGRVLVTVWAFEQRNAKTGQASEYVKWGAHKEESQPPDDTKVVDNNGQQSEVVGNDGQQSEVVDKTETSSSSSTLPVHVNLTQFKQQDLLVPWQVQPTGQQTASQTQLRFYHVFREGELETLCARLVPACHVDDVFYEQGNWCAELCKL